VDKSARQEVIVARSLYEFGRPSRTKGPDLYLRTSESGLIELVELGKISARLNDVDLGICADIYEAEFKRGISE
jgi:hypothetical protein